MLGAVTRQRIVKLQQTEKTNACYRPWICDCAIINRSHELYVFSKSSDQHKPCVLSLHTWLFEGTKLMSPICSPNACGTEVHACEGIFKWWKVITVQKANHCFLPSLISETALIMFSAFLIEIYLAPTRQWKVAIPSSHGCSISIWNQVIYLRNTCNLYD
jgi:hypothetical protein